MTMLLEEETPNLLVERISEGCACPILGQPFLQSPTPKSRNVSRSKTKVLVADDEQVIADTLALIFSHSGFEARAVYGGKEAVAAVSGFEPDILVSDVMMPRMSGIDAAIAILALRPSCKVLFISGQAATADVLNKARAQGLCFEILAKPVHPAKLLEKLREVISQPYSLEHVQEVEPSA